MSALKLHLLLATSLLFLIGCNKNDEANLIDNNSWNLTNISGGIQGSDIEYADGEISWSFNSKDGNLFVNVNLKDSTKYYFLEEGIYQYRIENEDGIENLLINNYKFGIITIQKDELHISNGHVDGYNYIFKK